MTLTAPEIALLRSIVEQMAAVLDAPEQVPRLLPPAYIDDDAAQQEYARLMSDDLLDGKRRALASMRSTLERGTRMMLTDDEAQDWLAVLNDARLTLGTRLDVTEETYDKDIDPAAPDAAAHEVFRYLGYLEEWLVETLMG